MSEAFKAFAVSEYNQHPDKIREWAAQSHNLLLKQLANEVLEVVGVR